jgi:Fe-S-cluster-containing dehydrogenase component
MHIPWNGGDPYCVQHCVPGALEWVDKTDDAVKKKKKLRSARMAMYHKLKKEAA